MKKLYFFFACFFTISTLGLAQQHSVARLWNEALLECIRNDFARPTVHARNLFHLSAAAYDAWAAYDSTATTYFLGRSHGNYYFSFAGVEKPENIAAAQEEAISFACYRLLRHRFQNSPGWAEIDPMLDHLIDSLGYDRTFTSASYETGAPAALGNYIAAQVIEFGQQDGANEAGSYQNLYYQPANDPLVLLFPGNPDISDPNRWQPLAFSVFIDQSGHQIPGASPPFLGPEWGSVTPFSLKQTDLEVYERDGHNYLVYHDPGPPCHLNDDVSDPQSEAYKWNFSLVSTWSSHLDPTDGVNWDISPGGIGNLRIEDFPVDFEDFPDFYDRLEGGDYSPGYTVNPKTGQPYEPQIVPRGDYARVLAEFWADGPASETPPGHWFTILNYVNDHPQLVKKFRGTGPEMDALEWDVKSYFTLGGAMHDVAISVWGIKGYYDFVRPISAIRYMAQQGQSSDKNLQNYSPRGIPLIPNFIEQVKAGDPLAGSSGEHVNKIKLYAWKGHDFIDSTAIDQAGVGWILAENWWPYQRPTFVTPPFAGYVSGHSTFSRAAATVLSLFTGDEYFPGGMGEFYAGKNEFLVFEEGPSQDIVLQWARYADASDQCSLSRIWGGIHPPVDDIPGRRIGLEIGNEAFDWAVKFFENDLIEFSNPEDEFLVYPNPVKAGNRIFIYPRNQNINYNITVSSITGATIFKDSFEAGLYGDYVYNTQNLMAGVYVITISGPNEPQSKMFVVE